MAAFNSPGNSPTATELSSTKGSPGSQDLSGFGPFTPAQKILLYELGELPKKINRNAYQQLITRLSPAFTNDEASRFLKEKYGQNVVNFLGDELNLEAGGGKRKRKTKKRRKSRKNRRKTKKRRKSKRRRRKGKKSVKSRRK